MGRRMSREMTELHVIALLVMIMAASISIASADSSLWNNNERLRKKLLEGYDKMSFPHRGPNDTTTVFYQLDVQGIWIEDEKQILQVNAWVLMSWTDPRLKYDSKDYGDLEVLHLASDEVWQPDIVLYNNADITNIDHYGKNHILVYPGGSVLWVPSATFRVHCPLDFTYWPYDVQSCMLYIASWTTHGWQIDLQLLRNRTEISLGWFGKYSSEWQYVGGEIHRHSKTYKCCPEPYITLVATVTMKRISSTFTSTVVIPACVVSTLTLLQFLLPVREKKRLLIGCCSALFTLIELVYLGSAIPRLSSSTPIIVTFYGQTFVVVTVSVAITAILLRLTDTKYPAVSTPPPNLLRTIVSGPLASVLFLQHYTEKISRSGGGDNDAEVLDEETKNSINYEPDWLLVAAVFDRLAAIGFFITFFVTLITYVAPV